jgi:DNA-binding IclR family transcriptional regulator
MADVKKRQLIGSLTKGLIILETLMEKKKIGVTELGTILGVNKSSAYRLLSTLEERGFVEQESETGKYRLGIKLARLEAIVLDGSKIREISYSYLKELTARTCETSSLSVLSENQGIIIEKINSEEKISANPYIGMVEPLYCTALGKAILSSFPEEKQREILESLNIIAYTPKTITQIPHIIEDLKRTAVAGVAVDDEEYSLGMRCIAAAVYDHKGETIAAIGISGPISRMRTEIIDKYITIVKEVASEFSLHLGYKK